MRAALLAVAALAAPAAAPAHMPEGARGGDPIARGAQDQDTAGLVAARTRIFGAQNVDQDTGAVRRDRVVLSWFGVTNFAMAIRGHVVLLDAWVPRGEHSGYVPTTPAQLARLRPEYILLGHAHFDHAADAVPIALASGATIVGTAEQCTEMAGRAPAMPPRCVAVIPAGAAPGATAQPDLLPGVQITTVKHVHSAARSPDGSDGYHVPVTPGLSSTPLTHPPTPQDMVDTLGHLPDAEAGTILHRFRVGDLSLLWHDSAGPLDEDAPGVYDVFRSLRPIDVQVGAIQGFNQLTNGLRDPRKYIEAFAPDLFVPAHHDDWAPGITSRGDAFQAPLARELARIPAERRPQVRFIRDPHDYVRPELLTFPVAYEPVRLTRRCVGGGRLRVALAGDSADVRRLTVAIGARRRTDTTAPFGVTFPRSALEGTRATRLRASAGIAGAEPERLRRSLPGCGVR